MWGMIDKIVQLRVHSLKFYHLAVLLSYIQQNTFHETLCLKIASADYGPIFLITFWRSN